ncbi:MAG TPA: integrase [Candidatus Saccharimonadales bacterium]|nr:integrase [Candidatus Saccharimonadales bacterium]
MSFTSNVQRKKVNHDILNNPLFWKQFEKYLSGFNTKKTIYSRLTYAKKYHNILFTEKFNEMLQFSKDKIGHIMKALAALSKFFGIYDKWNLIVKKYDLKWSERNSLNTFKKLFNSSDNLENYFSWIKSFVKDDQIAKEYKNLVTFCTLTELRACEAIESIKIIKDDSNRDRYLDKKKNILKHYEFQDIFIRKTKKAYFSVVNIDIVRIAMSANSQVYSTLKSQFYRNNIKLNLSYCRKVFATYLRNKGIEPEIIDLLQGRISNSVFVNHYYRPDINQLITKSPMLDESMKYLMTKTH